MSTAIKNAGGEELRQANEYIYIYIYILPDNLSHISGYEQKVRVGPYYGMFCG